MLQATTATYKNIKLKSYFVAKRRASKLDKMCRLAATEQKTCNRYSHLITVEILWFYLSLQTTKIHNSHVILKEQVKKLTFVFTVSTYILNNLKYFWGEYVNATVY